MLHFALKSSVQFRRSLLLISSMFLLCFVVTIAFSDPANLTRLFVGGDGAYVRLLIRQQYNWYGYAPGNLLNFWQGTGNVYLLNSTGMLTYSWQTLLFGSGEIDPILSHATAAVFLFLSAYLVASLINLPLRYSLLAGWILALLGVPFFGSWQLFPGLLTIPHFTELILGEVLVLQLFSVIGRTSIPWTIAVVLAIILVIAHLVFFNFLLFVVIVPVIVLYSILLLSMVSERKEFKAKTISVASILAGLFLIGAPQFILGNLLYTSAGMLMSDIDPGQSGLDFVSIVFYLKNDKLLAPLLFVFAVVGSIFTVWWERGLVRRMALALLVFAAMYVGGGSLIIQGSTWKGPMPIYFEVALYPFYAAFTAVALRFAIGYLRCGYHSGLRLVVQLPERVVSKECVLAFKQMSGLVLFFLPLSLLPLSYGEPWTGFPYPPRHTELTKFLRDEIGLEPGRQFRGFVATFAGYKDTVPGEPLNPYNDVDLPFALATGNDHHAFGLWFFDIPTLVEYSQLTTPPFYLIGTRFLARPGDFQFRTGVIFTKVNIPLLQAMGVRFIIADAPLEEPAMLRRTLVFSGERLTLRLYELPHANLGQYSPTFVRTVTNATEILRELEAGTDLAKTVITTEPLPDDLMVANASKVFVEPWGFDIRAESPRHSVLILPVQYTRCLEIQSEGSPVKLFRANLLQTGLLFSGNLNGRIRFRNGPFEHPGCRLRDWWEMKQLNILGAAQAFPRKSAS